MLERVEGLIEFSFSWVGNAIRDVITPTKHQTDNKLCISTTSNMRVDLETCFHYPADVRAKLSHGNHAGSLCFFWKRLRC